MSIRKFGLIFILGLFLLSIGVCAVAATGTCSNGVCIIDYQSVTQTTNDNFAYSRTLTSTVATNLWWSTGFSEATDANYLSISTYSGGEQNPVFETAASYGGTNYTRAIAYQRYEFNVTKVLTAYGIGIDEITKIEVYYLVYGKGFNSGTTSCTSESHASCGTGYYAKVAVHGRASVAIIESNSTHTRYTVTSPIPSYGGASWIYRGASPESLTISINEQNGQNFKEDFISAQGIFEVGARGPAVTAGSSSTYSSSASYVYTDIVYLKVYYTQTPAPTWVSGGTPVTGATYSSAPGIQFSCPAEGSCKVQIATSEDNLISSVLVHESGLMGAGTYTYTSYSLPAANTYYLRIVNTNTAYSTTKSFTYSTPGAFSLISPEADYLTVSLSYALQWAQPSGGSGGYTYAVQVAPNSNWDTNELQRLVNVTGTAQTSYTLLSSQGFTNGITYFARIIATDSGGQSSISGTRAFVISNVETPSITLPTNGATVGLPFIVTWPQVAGGTSPYTYTVKVGTNEYGVGSATSYLVTSAGGSVSIQVKATDATAKSSPWSSEVMVTVSNPTPTSIISPLQGATVASPFTINWTDVGSGATYRVFLCENTCGSLAVSSTGVATSTDNVRESPIKYSATGGLWLYTSPSSLTNGPWVARVYTIDSNGIYSSTYASVQLTVSNLVGPQVASPSAGQAISKVADVTWTAATGGVGSYLYRVRICKNSSCSPSNMIVVDKTVEGVLTTNIPSGALDDGGYYYMQVQATENITGGATTAWSQIRGFSVTQSTGSTLSRPNILVPSITGLSTTTAPTITWESIGNNITYTIQVADNALFSSPAYTATTTSLSQTVPLSSLSAGRYYVRIMGSNYLNQESPWSVVREFQYNTVSTPVVLECSPACTTGQTCTNGVCADIPVTANEVRGTFVEVPKQLELGQSYFFKANMMSTASTTEGTFNVRIFSGATTLYTSSFTMQVSPQGDNKGITIDIPPDLEVPAGTYTIQVTDSRGVVVASAEVPLKTSTNPLDGIMGGDITTIAIVAGCAGLAIVSYIAMKSVFSKTKGKEKAAAKRVALRLRNSVKPKRKAPRRQAKVQKHQKKKQRRR